jgi:predicted metal-dependent phosphoesterase TrpH
MPGCIDLHIHSEYSSDGDHSVESIVRMAREADLRAISITDHDTTAAYPEALEAGTAEGVEVIPGIELTTLYEGREFHLLLPFLDWESTALEELTKRVAAGRFQEARERVDKLVKLGFDLSWDEVQGESAPFAPLGVTIAQVILRKAAKDQDPSLERYGQGRDVGLAPYAFYKDYFTEGRPAFVPRRALSLLEVLDLIPSTGGVPVLAHPGAEFQQTGRNDLLVLKERGLEGLEVYTTYHNKQQTEHYAALAREFDLVATAGSDFHGRIKPQISLGIIREGTYQMVEKLRHRRPHHGI